MNKNYILKGLADIGAKAANSYLPEGVSMCVLNGAPPHHVVAREAFTKAILDAIGYELTVDEEREAFERWLAEQGDGFHPCGDVDKAFAVWKAGREELRQAINKPSYSTPEQIDESIQNLTTKEPAWIPWDGGDKSPIPGKQTRYEVKDRDGVIHTCTQNNFVRGEHSGPCADIIAYRILD